jgi:hypothetical protein
MSRPVGCLLWLIILLVLLIVIALMFGGFQKGTKVSARPALTTQHWCPCVAATARAVADEHGSS